MIVEEECVIYFNEEVIRYLMDFENIRDYLLVKCVKVLSVCF